MTDRYCSAARNGGNMAKALVEKTVSKALEQAIISNLKINSQAVEGCRFLSGKISEICADSVAERINALYRKGDLQSLTEVLDVVKDLRSKLSELKIQLSPEELDRSISKVESFARDSSDSGVYIGEPFELTPLGGAFLELDLDNDSQIIDSYAEECLSVSMRPGDGLSALDLSEVEGVNIPDSGIDLMPPDDSGLELDKFIL